MAAITKAFSDEILSTTKQKADIDATWILEKQYVVYKRYARRHHDVFMTCMELTKKKISSESLMKNIIEPNLAILTTRNIPEGVHALKELKLWIETDYNSFIEYTESYWHDRTRVCDMIKRIETETFSKAKKYLEQKYDQDDMINTTKKNRTREE